MNTRTNVAPSVRPVIYEGGPLTRIVRQDVARKVRSGHSGMSPLDQQFLSDFSAGKYRMPGLDRLVGLHVEARTVESAYALPDSLALHIAEQRWGGAMPYEDASHAETQAVAAADPVQHEVLTTRCPSKSMTLLELLLNQRRTTDQLIAAVLRLVKESR